MTKPKAKQKEKEKTLKERVEELELRIAQLEGLLTAEVNWLIGQINGSMDNEKVVRVEIKEV